MKELMYRLKLNSNTLLDITQSGKIKLSIPRKSRVFQNPCLVERRGRSRLCHKLGRHRA